MFPLTWSKPDCVAWNVTGFGFSPLNDDTDLFHPPGYGFKQILRFDESANQGPSIIRKIRFESEQMISRRNSLFDPAEMPQGNGPG